MISVVIWLLTLVGLPKELNAQPGLSVHFPQQAETTMRLSAYTGLDLVFVDSIRGDETGLFRYDSILPLGMYVLDSGQFSMEFLSVGNPLECFVDGLDDTLDIRFVDCPENTRWRAYLALREKHQYGRKDPETFWRLTDSLMEGVRDYATALILVDRDSALHESDFADASLIPTNVLTTKIVYFLEQSDAAFVPATDQLLKMAKVNMESYEFVLQYLLKGFTALGLSEVTDHLLNFPQIGEGEITEEEGMRLERLTEPYQKVRVGVKAPDFQVVSIDGKSYHLYESSAPHVIVFFWAVDCEYCHDFLTNIRKNLDLENEYELVTFAIADSEKEVRRELKKLKLKGVHCYDAARWEGRTFLDYHVMSTPTAFVLDGDKTIVAKPYDWGEMRAGLEVKGTPLGVKSR